MSEPTSRDELLARRAALTERLDAIRADIARGLERQLADGG